MAILLVVSSGWELALLPRECSLALTLRASVDDLALTHFPF